MVRFFNKTTQIAGLAPGTLEYVGPPKVDQVRVSIIDYDAEQIQEQPVSAVEEVLSYRDSPTTTWIDVKGLHDIELLQKLGDHYRLHPLVLEDIVNTRQRPKLEDHQDYLYVVCRAIYFDSEKNRIQTEQISLVLGRGFVLSLQEKEGDIFEQVRHRLRAGKGRIRRQGPDYLLYALLDAVVDNYFLVAGQLEETIEELEEGLLEDPAPDHLHTIHGLKREMILLRRAVGPLREVISNLYRFETELVTEGTEVFLRDVYDHTILAAEAVDTYRDLLSGLQDLYLSALSHKMNEVMKVLTIIATIFVPLTFVAGIYGMNFASMPELNWKWGYTSVWVVFLIVAGLMIWFFRRRRWL